MRNQKKGTVVAVRLEVSYTGSLIRRSTFGPLELFSGLGLFSRREIFSSPLLAPVGQAEQESLSRGSRWSPGHGTGLRPFDPKMVSIAT